MEPIEQTVHANCIIEIHQDSFGAENPRGDCNLGTMYCWHQRYDLGDNHPYTSPNDLRDSLAGNDIVLQLYLYDHSGISISCSSWIGRAQHADWDSGPVGYIIARAEDIRKEYGVKRISPQLRERVIGYLKSEVETYDSYLRGEVYGYKVEHMGSEETEDCWGFIGEMKYCLDNAKYTAECLDKAHRKAQQHRVKQLIKARVPLSIRQDILTGGI